MVICRVPPRKPPIPQQQFEKTPEGETKVYVRKRPLSAIEIAMGEIDIADVNTIYTLQINKMIIKANMNRYIERRKFSFDRVFDDDDDNKEVYGQTVFPLIEYIFRSRKAICFAYGQKGSGKTFTMFDREHGLCALAAKDIFRLLEDQNNSHLKVHIGFYEVCQKQLYDLLDNRKKITGLKEREVNNSNTLVELFNFGNTIRSTGNTGAILQIVLKHKNEFYGKISFVDLAGNNRDLANTKTIMEAAEINQSLLTLNECIRALYQDKKHIPFRNSKLTQVLKDSFVESSRICMFATISPNNSNIGHTLNTLRYARRVKK